MDLVSRGIQLAVRIDTIVYPIDPNEFLVKLNDIGGYLTAKPETITPKGIPMRKGDTCYKEDVVLTINPGVLSISLVGLDGKEMSLVLDEVITTFNECGGNSEKNIKFIEIVTQHEITTTKNALDSISSFLKSVPTSEIDEILGSKSELFTLKFTPKGSDFTSTEYYEVVFEPLKRNFGKSYFCTMEFRTKNYEKLQTFLSNVDDIVSKLISVIEK